MPRHVFPARHSVNPLIRFADLLLTRQAKPDDGFRGRCAELWVLWGTRNTPADTTRRSSALSAFVDVWTAELSKSSLDPTSAEGIEEYQRQLVRRGLAKTTIWMNLNYLRLTLDDLGLDAPDVRIALRRVMKSEAVKHAPLSGASYKHLTLRHSQIRRAVTVADPGAPCDVAGVAFMLVMYECMADISELLGRPATVLGAQIGLQLDDVDLTRDLVRLNFPAPFAGWARRTCTLSRGASEWLRLWVAIRGSQPGLVFIRRPNNRPEMDRRFVIQTMAAWEALRRKDGVLARAGIDPGSVGAVSFKVGRALGLFEGGHDLNYIASQSSWQTPSSMLQALCKAIDARKGARMRRESCRLDWPLPGNSGADQVPAQAMLF